MSAYFIAGTGTDIGKTFVSCAFAHAGFRAYKPVVSGFAGEDTDTHRLIAAMGRGDINGVSPWRYQAPLSPDMAAAHEGKTVPYDKLLRWSRAKLEERAVFEGAGGVMVPLDTHHTTRDWMEMLGLPVILVAGSYLGSISHTLTALEALRNLKLQAIILNESEKSTVTLEATRETLSNHTDALIVMQPRVSSYREAHATHALAKELA